MFYCLKHKDVLFYFIFQLMKKGIFNELGILYRLLSVVSKLQVLLARSPHDPQWIRVASGFEFSVCLCA